MSCIMKLSYVISTQPTRFQAVAFAQDLEANIAHLAELGYDGVELAVREPALLDAQAIKQMIDKHKLLVPALGTGQAFVEEGLSFTDPDATVREHALKRIKAHITLAQEFNAMVIIGLVRGKISAGASGRALLLDAMKRIAAAASDNNVRLVIEPINRYETNLLNTVAETLTLIDEIGADNIGVLFDTFHANIEEPQMESSMQACGSRLFHIHIADSNRWAAGFGHTDFAPILATLRRMNYNGWLSAEILPKPDVYSAREQAIKAMRAILKPCDKDGV